tara:strand:- start:784 stop:1818 length:1035 start_codon:yes stop_codon:yes gene_type:complete
MIIAVITTTALYLIPNVPDRAIFLTFILSFISGFSIIRVMAELLFFKEINNIYKALENVQDEKLASIYQSKKSYFNPLKKINNEISSYASRKQNEIDELKKMAAFRKEFIADVSHELKTPIFSAQGFVHTLLDGAIDNESVRENFLKKAAKSLDRLDLLVQDLMTITQIEKGEINMYFESFDLVELSIEVMDQLEKKAYQKQVKLQLLHSKDQPAYVSADYRRIYQVILNLLANAINYAGSGAQVIIKITPSGRKVIFELSDNGIGIPEKDLTRIFERFYRVDKSRSKETGGSGLGLSIVKHIIESHQSKINVESSSKKGTKFWFQLKASTALKSEIKTATTTT